MNRRIAVGLAALILALPLPVLAQAGDKDLRAQIAKMSEAWQTTYNAGDAAALTALYTSDAKVMAPGAEPVSGAAAIQKFFAADIANGAKNILTPEDVVGSGDVAVETGGWVAQDASGKHLDHGTFMTLYKKVNGAWKIYRDTWNSSMTMKM
jgi:ketosteroid isomerase-like protein